MAWEQLDICYKACDDKGGYCCTSWKDHFMYCGGREVGGG